MMHGWGYRMSRFSGGGMLMMGIFWIAIIAVVIYFVKNSNRSTNMMSRNKNKIRRDPIEIAKERYANGEISKKELQEIKQELNEY